MTEKKSYRTHHDEFGYGASRLFDLRQILCFKFKNVFLKFV